MTSGQNGSTAGVDAFTRMWTDFATRMMSAGMSFSPDSPPPEIARNMRGAMFQAMSRYAEEFMQSPQFLEAMKQSMDMGVQFRKMVNDFLGRVQFELQGVTRGDVDALVTRLKHMETRILDRLDDLAARLERLDEQLGPPAGTAPRQAMTEPGQAARPARSKDAPAGAQVKRGAR
ncbi:MAG TPA: hypothetical protein PKG54_19680 [Phycisphaerae bacterium]|jgi:hypothetical protein|nr:hypothetical protein [Phycisphaerae bacterium]HOB76738.1 hypothetical protein [Phycisphaerae bacterium]HOJ56772.1 hypothetical protein [Phycisphaerae bacterium]HOL28524.1 hypothetical protein [Phycisphaerae bacterium]HPP23042.1 hypothetical protein [Phycisphaerae bacterium]